jgi:hypothetical protein
MAKSINYKRVSFPKGEQNKLINRILSKISIQEAARLCNLSERTIRDWRREKFLMDTISLHKLCRKTNIPIPSNIKLKDRWWYTRLGASIEGKIIWEKYGSIGDPEYRKKKWYEWWEKEGKYKYDFIGKVKPIKKPKKSKDLAEFVGIVLDDGGITQRQIIITLHHIDDKEYGKFVINLIKRLFNIRVGTHHNKKCSVINYIISRSELVRFCVEKLDIKRGNKVKQQANIPNWIKQDRQYSIACARGLIDTDGCIFTHRYKTNNKWYSYKKLTFTSYSKPLRQFVFNILKDVGIKARMAREVDVRIDSIKDMQRYFQIISSHNPKHLNRYLK